jgi:hypothetical protein
MTLMVVALMVVAPDGQR